MSDGRAGVTGLDMEEDDRAELRSLMLVGTRLDGAEEEVGLIDAELIRQSAFLMGTRWADKESPRVVIDVLPQLLHLLVRFGKLVIQHNSQQTPAQARTAYQAGVSALGEAERQHIQLPVKSLPPALGWHNREMHLPYIIGRSPVLAEFLNILAERPLTVFLCQKAAERMLWEPAQTAFLLKFGTILHGLSIPFMEQIWLSGGNEQDNVRALDTVLKLTNKFFEPPAPANKKLLPPAPAPQKSAGRRRPRAAKSRSRSTSATTASIAASSSVSQAASSLTGSVSNQDAAKSEGTALAKKIPPPPDCHLLSYKPKSIHEAMLFLSHWQDDSSPASLPSK